MFFYRRGGCFGSCSCSQKTKKNLDLGRDSLYFQVFPGQFYLMRGESLVELTEHDDSAADDAMVHGMYVLYVLLHS